MMEENKLKDAEILDSYKIIVNKVPTQVHIFQQKRKPVPFYTLSLLDVSDNTKLIIEKIREQIINEVSMDLINLEGGSEEEKIKQKFKDKIMVLMKRYFRELDDNNIQTLTNYVVLTSLGLGEIEFLLKDPNLEEIVINSAKEPVWVYHKYYAWLMTNIVFQEEDKIRHFSTTISRNVNKSINILTPLLDAHLLTGERVNATLAPITSRGNTITIRKFSEIPWTITDFLKNDTISYEAAAIIWQAIHYELSIFTVGGTGSGKTSALNVMSNFMPPNQRIISIEDTRELQLSSTLHWVPMETRMANPEGKGQVAMLDLMINALRMRPDRIIVGEVRRAKEAEVLFEAMHTGHSSYATFHASNVDEAMARLTSAPMNIPKTLLPSLGLILSQHRNRRTGVRKTLQIAEILADGTPNMLLQHNPYKNKTEKVSESVSLVNNLKLYAGFDKKRYLYDLNEKINILKWLVSKGINDVNEIGLVMSEYYTDKAYLLKNILGGLH